MNTSSEFVKLMQEKARSFNMSFRDYYNDNRSITQISSLNNKKELTKSSNRFNIVFRDIPSPVFSMFLDFNPLLEAFNLDYKTDTFILSHWNVGVRVPEVRMGEFGFYIANKGKIEYRVIPHEQFLPSIYSSRPIQIESTLVLPTAVLLHRSCVLVEVDEGYLIEQL